MTPDQLQQFHDTVQTGLARVRTALSYEQYGDAKDAMAKLDADLAHLKEMQTPLRHLTESEKRIDMIRQPMGQGA